MGIVIETHRLSKVYAQQTVVDHIGFSVSAGECFGVLGPNGAGKSTTLRMLTGQTPPSSGDVTVLGYAIPRQAREMHRYLGVVPQKDDLDPDFSVLENLHTFATYFQLPKKGLAAKFDQLLQFVDLQAKKKVGISALSGGMRRRLSLIRAMVNDPKVLVLDEPTTGLDPQARQFLWQKLRELVSQGKTIVLTTHYMEEAERLCDRLMIMNQGRIVAEGQPQVLLRESLEAFVVEILQMSASGLQSLVPVAGLRLEQMGSSLLCYTADPIPLMDKLNHHTQIKYISRRTNLEDLFIKLTGHELQEN